MAGVRMLAKAVDIDFGYTNAGDEQTAVTFEATDGESVGNRFVWYGYFSEKAAPYTIKGLRDCGWTGNDIGAITVFDLTEEVEIEVVTEMYEGKEKTKVNRVNKPGQSVAALKNKMGDAQKKAFGAKFKGLVMRTAPAPTAQRTQPTQARKSTASAQPAERQPGDDSWDDGMPSF